MTPIRQSQNRFRTSTYITHMTTFASKNGIRFLILLCQIATTQNIISDLFSESRPLPAGRIICTPLSDSFETRGVLRVFILQRDQSEIVLE